MLKSVSKSVQYLCAHSQTCTRRIRSKDPKSIFNRPRSGLAGVHASRRRSSPEVFEPVVGSLSLGWHGQRLPRARGHGLAVTKVSAGWDPQAHPGPLARGRAPDRRIPPDVNGRIALATGSRFGNSTLKSQFLSRPVAPLSSSSSPLRGVPFTLPAPRVSSSSSQPRSAPSQPPPKEPRRALLPAAPRGAPELHLRSLPGCPRASPIGRCLRRRRRWSLNVPAYRGKRRRQAGEEGESGVVLRLLRSCRASRGKQPISYVGGEVSQMRSHSISRSYAREAIDS